MHAIDQRSIDKFKELQLTQGFDEVVERVWGPNEVDATHAHAFAVKALVVRGEMWLTCEGRKQHLRPGDTFELGHSDPHAERYGGDGAVYWAARKVGA